MRYKNKDYRTLQVFLSFGLSSCMDQEKRCSFYGCDQFVGIRVFQKEEYVTFACIGPDPRTQDISLEVEQDCFAKFL